MSVSNLLFVIDFFVSLLHGAAVKHEAKAVDLQKSIEALLVKQQNNFTEAVRARSAATKIGDLVK